MKKISISGLFISLFLLCGVNAAAAQCELSISSTDQMQFTKKTLEVSKECKKVTLTLKHNGKLPVNVMGHNWVLTSSDDIAGFATAMSGAGADNDYVVKGDPRVIAYTKVIGGGGETTVEFDVSKLDTAKSYTYVCTFPGHYALMKGELKFS